jgi:periplasmic protein TonB
VDVSDVLRDRMREPSGLQRTIAISLVAHAGALTIVFLAPGQWMARQAPPPRNVMTISLAGAGEGPRNGGMTAASQRPTQVAAPPEELPKREAVRPPAAKTPEMVLPTKTSTRPTRPAKPTTPIKEAPEQARGTTPTRGAQVSGGSSLANTAVRGQGFGLSTGGGAGSGSTLDVADFCCPDYIVTMVERIRSAWNDKQGATGMVRVKFTIQRTGGIAGASVEASSGNPTLDLAALRAVVMTKTLPPLPDQFQYPALPVHLNFEYK